MKSDFTRGRRTRGNPERIEMIALSVFIHVHARSITIKLERRSGLINANLAAKKRKVAGPMSTARNVQRVTSRNKMLVFPFTPS